jgi:MinD superfamily P-loop ATPase
MIRELVVISGKGGTGKTSLTASLAVLAEQLVVVDCDVDAADLHMLLVPQIRQKQPFYSGKEAIIRAEKCIGCGICQEYCRFAAVVKRESAGGLHYSVDFAACEGCGVCVHFCPTEAIDFPERLSGDWMISETRVGPMVHARLGVAAENSGKLVTLVRREARAIAEREGHSLIISDGPPGIGCPVIASLTGASQVLVITEPTVSGEHDLGRVLGLARHFNLPAAICVNKWDLNPEMTKRIENKAHLTGARILGRIRYDPGVTQAMMQAKSIVETEIPAADDIKALWHQLQ